MNKMRLCNPFEYKGALEYGGKRFTGAYSGLTNSMLDYMTTKSNISIEIRSKSDGIGELNSTTGLYDGCLGRLQRNESDILTQLVDYPSNIAHTKQGDIGMSGEAQYVGLYEPRTIEEVNSVKIESCFKSFSHEVWLACFLTVLVTYMLLMVRLYVISKVRIMIQIDSKNLFNDPMSKLVGSKFPMSSQIEPYCRTYKQNQWGNYAVFKQPKVMRKTNNNFLFNVLSHMLRFGTLTSKNGLFNKIIFILLSLFSLVVVHYFSSFIKTELVSIFPPEIPQSYKELVMKDVAVVYIDGFPQYKDFKFAPIGSYENILWQRTDAKFETVFWSLEQNANTLSLFVKRLEERKLVLAIDSFLSPMVLYQLCDNLLNKAQVLNLAKTRIFPLSEDSNKIPYIAQDPYIKSISKGLIFSSGFNGYKYIQTRKRVKRFLETGLAIKAILDIHLVDIFKAMRPVPSRDESNRIRICKSGTIISPEVHLVGIQLENIKYFLLYIFTSLAFTIVVFVCELFFNRQKGLILINEFINKIRQLKKTFDLQEQPEI